MPQVYINPAVAAMMQQARQGQDITNAALERRDMALRQRDAQSRSHAQALQQWILSKGFEQMRGATDNGVPHAPTASANILAYMNRLKAMYPTSTLPTEYDPNLAWQYKTY